MILRCYVQVKQVAEYYKTRPSAVAILSKSAAGDCTEDPHTLSEYDKHRKTLISDDVVEGWASELRRYLHTMQLDVKKDTDIVEWWQVSKLTYLYLVVSYSKFHRTMLNFIRHLRELRLTFSHRKHHLCLVNGCSRV